MSDNEFEYRHQLAIKALEKAKQANKTYMGPCSECKWRRWSSMGRTWDECSNPVVRVAALNCEQGYGRDRIVRCDEQRKKSSSWGEVLCGPQGVLFEPNEWSPLFWGFVAIAIVCLIGLAWIL